MRNYWSLLSDNLKLKKLTHILLLFLITFGYSCKNANPLEGSWYFKSISTTDSIYIETYIDSSNWAFYIDGLGLRPVWQYRLERPNQIIFLNNQGDTLHQNVRFNIINDDLLTVVYSDTLVRQFHRLKRKEASQLKNLIYGNVSRHEFYSSFLKRKQKYCRDN
jgi:hypothetical protein